MNLFDALSHIRAQKAAGEVLNYYVHNSKLFVESAECPGAYQQVFPMQDSYEDLP